MKNPGLKKVRLSVTDFALPAPRTGSIDSNSGFGRGSQTGIEIHQRIQAEKLSLNPSYKAEVSIVQTFERENYLFEVAGRIDGLFQRENSKIEEIKSAFNAYDLARQLKETEHKHPYCIQLKTYGYFYYLQNQQIPELSMHLVSSRNFETFDIEFKLDIKSYETWLELRLLELVSEAKIAEKRSLRRKKASCNLQFPFLQPRAGQVDLIETIRQTMNTNRPMLIQAPTGLGKTIGVLYPTLQEAMSRGQKVIYVTPKNSQHSVAEDAVEKLQVAGATIKSMTLTAKSKICFKNEPICNPEFCEYAKDHYQKVAENNLLAQLAKKKSLTERTFKKMAEENQVCPFELQLAAAHEADVVICDYNYIFAPRALLSKATGLALDQEGQANLVIDEAHNLPARAMDYYSPALSTFTLERMRTDLNTIPKKFRIESQQLLDECIQVVRHSGPQECSRPLQISPPVESFRKQDLKLRQFLSTYLSSDVDIKPNDVVLRFSFYWSEFTNALEFVSGQRKEFFTTFSPSPAIIKITCCDASEMLKKCYQDFNQVVAFSATLKPFQYYTQLSGLTEKNLQTSEFVSPFPSERRKILIIPQISSRYSQREQSYAKIAETVLKISSLKRGNYFVFFPSFDFMERVFSQFKVPNQVKLLKQERRMKKNDIQEILRRLQDPSDANIVFAVQGGVFSEGVDYPGDMIIGAFIIGPPLPNFDLERELMKQYYQENYLAGFDYAYTYPAMAKAVQAAGRVIRSETDKGIIILIDDRFIQPSYVKSMPQDWYVESPLELVSAQILKDISEFWERLSYPE